ncbi:MAG: amino acid adenylation domain-containing protein [Clostridiales bacterium]|nr:amino acid adenylation domain-containing protein [Clostridiales bacterium]
MLAWLEKTEERVPDSIAVAMEDETWSYGHLMKTARQMASALIPLGKRRCPMVVLFEKSPWCVAAMLSVVYSGNFYVVLDDRMPEERMKKILDSLEPVLMITDRAHEEMAEHLLPPECIRYREDLEMAEERQELLRAVREDQVDTDPMYALYTSGSTGMPKGALVSHRAVMAYTEWVVSTFSFGDDTVLGSQTPFYFSMSVTDLFGALRSGGRLQIIPKKLFSFPLALVEYMNRYRINTIYWVPTALGLVANWNTFAYAKPEYLKMVLFAGESMPNRLLNIWRRNLPDVLYANLFGPTETTDICTYYVVDREFSDEETLPIGKACSNCNVFAVTEEGKEAGPGEMGELYARGSFLALGYYRNGEKTREAFVQNPLHDDYPEIVYRTGDLVRWNERGELLYLGRKDFQIKHMGYRIELGEIEAAASAVEKLEAVVCLYEQAADQIILVYQGKIAKEKLAKILEEKLPAYMMPGILIRVKQMPVNANGKMDRTYLKNNYKTLMEQQK